MCVCYFVNPALSESSMRKSVQYHAALATKEAIRGWSPEILYQESILEHPHHRCWMRRLRLFYTILSNKVTKYIYQLVSPLRHLFRNPNTFTSIPCRKEYFKNSLFLYVMNDRNKLDHKIRSSIFYVSFRKFLINIIRPSECKIFNIFEQVSIKLLVSVRLCFSHLRKHRFRYDFEDSLNPLCMESETTVHFFFLHWFFSELVLLCNLRKTYT